MPPCPQIKGGKRLSKGKSAAEFKDVLKFFKEVAVEVMEEACGDNQELIEEMQPLFSFDNDSVHVDWDEVLDPTERVPLPSRSPDMHKVIEHIFNTLGHMLRVNCMWAFADHAKKYNTLPETWFQVLAAYLFDEKCISIESVQKDISSLKRTYNWIIDNAGRRAPRGYN